MKRGLVMTALVAVLAAMTATTASAAGVCKVASHNGMSRGIVIQQGKSDKFYSLVNEDMAKRAIRCCAACAPKVGTKINIKDGGLASSTVEVLEGPSKGCVGNLAAEQFKCDVSE